MTVFLLAGCSSDQDSTDEVIVDPPTQDDPLTTSNAASYMVDASATKETVALFYNLKRLSQTKTAIGQQDAFNSFYQDAGGDSDIKKNTGFDPAVLGSDFMFITDKSNNEQSDNCFISKNKKLLPILKPLTRKE